MKSTVQSVGLKSYEMSLSINRGQRSFNELLKICLSHHGLTIPKWSLLGKLYEVSTIRPGEASMALGIKPPFTAKIISSLEVSGYITLEPYADDERGKELRLTVSGRTLVETVEAKLQECLNNQLSSLEITDLKTYFALNDFIARNVRHH